MEAVVAVVGAVVSVCSMAVTLWTSRRDRLARAAIPEIEQQASRHSDLIGAVTTQLLAAERLRIRCSEVLRILDVGADHKPKRVLKELEAAMHALDDSRREFMDGWAPLHSGSASQAWTRVRAQRKACEDSLDVVLTELVTVRLLRDDSLDAAADVAEATTALRDQLSEFVERLGSFRSDLQR